MPDLFEDPPRDPDATAAPTRVCRHCSTQSQTAGEFCPSCGKSFVRRSRLSKRTKRVLIAAIAVLLLGGGGTGIALKVKHDNDVKAERERRAQIAEEKREREARERRAAEAEEERQAEIQAGLDEIELDSRRMLEKSLRKAITKDAEENVSLGILEGPILRTVCDPVGGGRDDLEARTGKYECIAVNEESADGTYRGWEYGATINYDKYSWSWELGG